MTAERTRTRLPRRAPRATAARTQTRAQTRAQLARRANIRYQGLRHVAVARRGPFKVWPGKRHAKTARVVNTPAQPDQADARTPRKDTSFRMLVRLWLSSAQVKITTGHGTRARRALRPATSARKATSGWARTATIAQRGRTVSALAARWRTCTSSRATTGR